MTPMTIVVDQSAKYARDMTRDQSWRMPVVEKIKAGTIQVIPVPILQLTEDRIEFNSVIERQSTIGLFGQIHAEAILKGVDKIPVDWHKIHIVFPATVWVDGPPIREVKWIPGLHLLYENVWELYFRWIVHGFTARDHALMRVD